MHFWLFLVVLQAIHNTDRRSEQKSQKELWHFNICWKWERNKINCGKNAILSQQYCLKSHLIDTLRFRNFSDFNSLLPSITSTLVLPIFSIVFLFDFSVHFSRAIRHNWLIFSEAKCPMDTCLLYSTEILSMDKKPHRNTEHYVHECGLRFIYIRTFEY